MPALPQKFVDGLEGILSQTPGLGVLVPVFMSSSSCSELLSLGPYPSKAELRLG